MANQQAGERQFRDVSPLSTRWRWGAEGGGITHWTIDDVYYVAINYLRWERVAGENAPLPAGSFSVVYHLPTRRSPVYREMEDMRPHREPCDATAPREIVRKRANEHRTGGWVEFWVPVAALTGALTEFVDHAGMEPAWDD